MKKMILILLFGVIIVSGCIESSNDDQVIGGQRDEHGCLGPAGYSYNKTLDVCLREWEITNVSGERDAIKIATEYLGNSYALTVISVDVARCPGCFVVHFDREQMKMSITLENLEVIDNKCQTDSDCIPFVSECHTTRCMNSAFSDNYDKAEICTMIFMPEAAYSPEDCLCQNNICVNKNLGRTVE